MLDSIHQLKIKGREATPILDHKHTHAALLLGSFLFSMSLGVGVIYESLAFLCESLLLVTLMWAIYRGSFPAVLFLLGYLLMVKSHQLIFLDNLHLGLRLLALGLSILLARGFYMASMKGIKSGQARTEKAKVFDLFDVFFAMAISLVAISISAVAIENHDVTPNHQSVTNLPTEE